LTFWKWSGNNVAGNCFLKNIPKIGYRKEGDAMKVIRNDAAATLTLVPDNDEERGVVNAAIELAKSEEKLLYGGREEAYDGHNIIFLHAGAQKEKREDGRLPDLVGGVKLTLCGSSEEDKHQIDCLRDCCFHGNGSVVFLEAVIVGNEKSIVITAARCKHCGAGMINYDRCEWKTCAACVQKCAHDYIKGLIHGPNGYRDGEYCGSCGQARSVIEAAGDGTAAQP
jgi:hypothetical protein